MPLTVAVQMDPIDRINIAGDSTFALLLEAQARGHSLLYYTPDTLSQTGGDVVAVMHPLTVRDRKGDHFTLGEAAVTPLPSVDVVLLRQDPPFDLAYITSTHLLERVHPATLVVNDPAGVRNAPEKLFVLDFPELMPPTPGDPQPRRHRGVPGRARRRGDEAALRQRRRRRVQGGPQGPPTSARSSTCSR